MHIFRHLFVCFQTSVYTMGEFQKNRNNSTVFEEMEVSIVDLTVANAVSIVDLTVANAVLLATL